MKKGCQLISLVFIILFMTINIFAEPVSSWLGEREVVIFLLLPVILVECIIVNKSLTPCKLANSDILVLVWFVITVASWAIIYRLSINMSFSRITALEIVSILIKAAILKYIVEIGYFQDDSSYMISAPKAFVTSLFANVASFIILISMFELYKHII